LDPGGELGDFRVLLEGFEGGVGFGELFFSEDGVAVAVAGAAEERDAVEAFRAIELAAGTAFVMAGARDEVMAGEGESRAAAELTGFRHRFMDAG
jgi:hypothetical protein